MHVLFLTANNLATNPRIYKELILALHKNCQVSLIQYKLGNWSDQKGRELLVMSNESNSIKNIEIDATHNNKIYWLIWGLLEKLARKVYFLFKQNIKINALASSRRSLQILSTAKKLKQKPDIICAHNLATLYPAFKLSQKWDIPFIFDIEDYHPGEFIRFDAVNEKKRREFLMKELLPKASALTSASPMIWEYTAPLLSPRRGEEGSPKGRSGNTLRESLPFHQVILNSFPQNEFVAPKPYKSNNLMTHQPNNLTTFSPNDLMTYKPNNLSTYKPLKLVWFSQKISFGRGLEQLFEALTQYSQLNTHNSILLALIGDLDPQFETQVIQPFRKLLTSHLSLLIKPPLSQPALHAELANQDIGLALEPGKDLNNKLAISNKIIAYAQAGLYILATDTLAQKQFMEEHKHAGIICRQNAEGIKKGVTEIFEKVEELRKNRNSRFEKGKELAWEKESEKLVGVWEEVMSV